MEYDFKHIESKWQEKWEEEAFSTPLTIPISPNFTDLSNFPIRAEQVCT